MLHGKKTIFLFFLIIGTSVFPNGSSAGLAYAKPWVGAAITGASLGMDVINRILGTNDQEAGKKVGDIIGGSKTHSDDNIIYNTGAGAQTHYSIDTNQNGHYSFDV
uniref:Uncharacterized protein n=1 Tax=Bracoviriform kariyai TaxID=199362 RepID=Q8B6D0_9VIRU|nr:hypothetical protein [Bracoviriform kariyai]